MDQIRHLLSWEQQTDLLVRYSRACECCRIVHIIAATTHIKRIFFRVHQETNNTSVCSRVNILLVLCSFVHDARVLHSRTDISCLKVKKVT